TRPDNAKFFIETFFIHFARRSSEHVERKLALQNPGSLGSVPAPARFDLDEHRTGTGSCNHHCVMHVKNPKLAVQLYWLNCSSTKGDMSPHLNG
ncbi:MAG: hypothetical protein PV344_02560, partial [Anaplasma sp.]|nr:hypothetical protein [Anaplasma sp.]